MAKPRSHRRTIAYAKAHFAECVRQAESGRSIVLTRHGRAVARIEPVAETVRPARDSSEDETKGDLRDEIAEPATTYASAVPPAFRSSAARRAALRRDLVEQIWPRIPKRLLGRGVSKEELEEILGYGSASSVGRELGRAVIDKATRGDRAKDDDT